MLKKCCFRSCVGQIVQEISRGFSVKPSYSIPKIIIKLVLCKQLNINIIRGKKVMISYMTTLTDIPAEFD